eukprot:TRINITY_DN3418_c1_g1_i1.p1 TRINITY_DN3418_c1_g1~~TRINITY_DN3418_c1_g1_i1.p1  ORF type:complete len:360 (+),score=92.71 TRINITY_DN3418_c1_g1_i1:996-2075(+)
MDPKNIANTAVDLNLKLMRWRILPDLQLDKISQTKCLLIGAGTLGCNIARCLMGWGVRQITFIDNGTVSYSNPVRQSLFEFDDCGISGGKSKAITASAKLAQIFPGVKAKGINMTIPMPGHSVSSADISDVCRSVSELEELVKQHDVIYLLTDSRESRWLPSLFGSIYDKVIINVALGFDTYLVMRHGGGILSDKHDDGDDDVEDRLGCYYCNDVVAPQDSQKDRTLDQQCTVSRPGLAYLASASAVELMISILHHPLLHHAPHHCPSDLSEKGQTTIGNIPHQLRGFLSHFSVIPLVGKAYKKCTGCSKLVMDEYESRGVDFLIEVFNDHTVLERITGLHEIADSSVNMEWVDDEDDF